MKRRRFLQLTSGAGLLALGCSAARRPPPHVVCVLVDQLRQDSFQSFATATMGLARNGVIFDQMRSVSPWTYPSVISMMSGLLPQQHGADGFRKSRTLTTFAPEVPLVSNRLRAAGWETAAFITNPFLREWNPFHIGFGKFSADFVKNLGNTRAGFHDFGIPEKMFAASVNDELRAHFDRRPVTAPEFTYVHYIDAHGPWGGAPFAPDYESAIRYVDARIAELYSYFRRRYDDDLVFIVTSDHGQALGDDVHIGEGPQFRRMKESLHEFNVTIPFVVFGGDRVAPGRRVPFPCSNIDFAPTVLELAGLAPTVPLPGRSLWPWIGPGRAPSPPADSGTYLTVSAFGTCAEALVWNGRKYMRHLDCATGEETARRVFDLAADPREERPLDVDFGEAEERLRELADPGAVRFEAGLEPISDEMAEKLRALGYVD
ncbi:MAG: sulfatase [Gemmatimonadetes bacterium]|nr:sulfatase [Gemmatimonadota bacterium]